MVQLRQQLSIEPMREVDVPTVQEIERHIFSTPWPRNAYYRELSSRNSAYYIVLRRDLDAGSELVGYGGMWRMYDEAHVTTIGVRRDLHHAGFGRILFAGLVQAAYDMGAKWITLEVRTYNDGAMRLHEGFGFKVIGRRKGTYTTNVVAPSPSGIRVKPASGGRTSSAMLSTGNQMSATASPKATERPTVARNTPRRTHAARLSATASRFGPTSPEIAEPAAAAACTASGSTSQRAPAVTVPVTTAVAAAVMPSASSLASSSRIRPVPRATRTRTVPSWYSWPTTRTESTSSGMPTPTCSV